MFVMSQAVIFCKRKNTVLLFFRWEGKDGALPMQKLPFGGDFSGWRACLSPCALWLSQKRARFLFYCWVYSVKLYTFQQYSLYLRFRRNIHTTKLLGKIDYPYLTTNEATLQQNLNI